MALHQTPGNRGVYAARIFSNDHKVGDFVCWTRMNDVEVCDITTAQAVIVADGKSGFSHPHIKSIVVVTATVSHINAADVFKDICDYFDQEYELFVVVGSPHLRHKQEFMAHPYWSQVEKPAPKPPVVTQMNHPHPYTHRVHPHPKLGDNHSKMKALIAAGFKVQSVRESETEWFYLLDAHDNIYGRGGKPNAQRGSNYHTYGFSRSAHPADSQMSVSDCVWAAWMNAPSANALAMDILTSIDAVKMDSHFFRFEITGYGGYEPHQATCWKRKKDTPNAAGVLCGDSQAADSMTDAIFKMYLDMVDNGHIIDVAIS